MKSKAEKQTAGTLRATRLRNLGTVPALNHLPDPPGGLSPEATAAWTECGQLAVELGTLSAYDVPLLAQLARALGSVAELDATLRADGSIIQSGEIKKAHPALQARDRARVIAAKLLGEFGLSPSGREKISFERPPSGDYADDDFNEF